MKLLLDTHVLVWAESLVDRLGPVTCDVLLDTDNTLLVSPVSALELSRLISLGRLNLRKPLAEWLAAARGHLALEDAPFTHAVAIDSYELPGTFHKDPADRMLVATARELDGTLVTADSRILAYPNVLTMDARK